MHFSGIEYVMCGGLREDYLITAAGQAINGAMGGNALYAAAGARVWSTAVGVVARVGNNYPADWLKAIQQAEIDTQGVKILDIPRDMRTFYAYLDPETRVDANPAEHYARHGLPLPPALRGYQNSTPTESVSQAFGPFSVRPTDWPRAYFNARGVHLAPASYATHYALPPNLRRQGTRYITCDPSMNYMQAANMSAIASLVRGLHAFLPSEMEVRALFGDTVSDLWQAAEALGAMGVQWVVMKLGARGQWLYDAVKRARWQVPAYPATVRDVTGAGDAFCGGFLAGLCQTDDPLEAVLYGNVAASLTVEGTGALYAIHSSRVLVRARLEALRRQVKQV